MPRAYTSRIEIVCQSCGNTFAACPSKCVGGRKKFCSVACRNLSGVTRIARTCEACGNPFTSIPSKVALGQGRFCSKDCASGTAESRFKKYAGAPTARGCVEWTGLRDEDGYGRIWTGSRMIGAHRFAWEKVNGPVPAGLLVLHKCDNPPCCNADHLFVGTHADNHADRNAKDRQAKGERSGNAKLTGAAVAAIRTLRGEGLSEQKIADRFGVTQTAVSSVLIGKTWKHV